MFYFKSENNNILNNINYNKEYHPYISAKPEFLNLMGMLL